MKGLANDKRHSCLLLGRGKRNGQKMGPGMAENLQGSRIKMILYYLIDECSHGRGRGRGRVVKVTKLALFCVLIQLFRK